MAKQIKQGEDARKALCAGIDISFVPIEPRTALLPVTVTVAVCSASRNTCNPLLSSWSGNSI